MATSLAQIEKLKGRENYDSWKFAVQTYLEHEELWECVTGEENDTKKVTKAKSKIILLIEPVNFVHVLSAKTAADVWKSLKTAFDDSGLTRRVSLLRTLITTKLEDCGSVETFVDKIITTAHKLSGCGLEVSDEWIGTLLLAGLPEQYKPMIMGIESSGIKITADAIKTKLLQDVKIDTDVKSNEVMFYSQGVVKPKFHNTYDSMSKFQKGPKCFACNNYGHIAKYCTFKKQHVNIVSENSNSNNSSSLCTTFAVNNVRSDSWYIDSGASAHMVNKKEWLNNIRDTHITEVLSANNAKLDVMGLGEVLVSLNTSGMHNNVEVKDVLYVPELCTNLLSVSQMVKNGKKVVFDINGCRIYNQNRQLIATATLGNGIFKLDVNEGLPECFEKNEGNQMSLISSGNSFELWHRRLGHINPVYLNKMKNGDVIGLEHLGQFTNKTCTVCLEGKQTRLPFNTSENDSSEILELVHSDLCGPIEVESLAGSKYILVFVDDFSKKVFVYFLKNKDKVKDYFVIFKTFAENQTGRKIKTLRSDNGGEYCNKSLTDYLQSAGIRHETTVPHTPEQNGTAERMNRTLVEKARCLLFDAKLGKRFWAEAVNTAAYLVNRSSCKGLEGKTPEETWTGKKPSLRHLKVFGCKAMAHVPKCKRKKFDPKSEACIMVGYCETSKGYRLYDPITRQVIVRRDVKFIEDDFSGYEEVDQKKDNGEFYLFEDEKNEVNIEHEQTTDIDAGSESIDNESLRMNETNYENNNNHERPMPRRSNRERRPVRFDDFVSYSVHNKTDFVRDPLTVKEALNRSDAECWKQAMKDEYDALMSNNTWDLTHLPPSKDAIDCKWVFKTKRDADGNIVRHKARLVIKGYAQKKGIDYEETYSPVVRYNTIRVLLSLAAKEDLDIDQMDAVTAFLQGDLEEEIYMLQPEGFRNSNKVCHLKKSLYGLKQASRVWNKKLDSSLKDFGLKQSRVDPCVYSQSSSKGILIVAIYVDDLLIFSNDQNLKSSLKKNLMSTFEMKDIGPARFVLGMQISRDRSNGKLWIDQEPYIRDMLHRFNMEDCNPIRTPCDENQRLTKDMSPKDDKELDEMKNVPFQQAVGSLLFAAQVSRPDINYAVNEVSRYNNNPGKPHWMAVKRIFRYLKGTSTVKLEFSRDNNKELSGYCDADWANDLENRRSISGFVFKFGGGAVSWSSKKQSTVALSTMEAEYMAISSATQEALWLRALLSEFIPEYENRTIPIFSDSKSAICLASTSSYHARSKHIDVKYHFVKEKTNDKSVKLQYLNSKEMPADFLTKPVNAIKHELCSKDVGLK